MRRFNTFCTTYNIWNPFPLTEEIMCAFVAYLAEQGLAPQTGKAYLSALRNAQISLGLPDPRDQSSLPLLKRVQAGISRIRLQEGSSARRVRLPITLPVLKKVQDYLRATPNPETVVIWAIACSAFFGFFRLGELLLDSPSTYNPNTCLSWGDVAVDSRVAPSKVQIHLKRSKCDQFGSGVDVVVGVTGTPICPVRAMVAYLEARGTRPGPFFVDTSGVVVKKPWFIARFRELLSAVGVPASDYAGHSFRIGAATTAAIAGVPDSTIQMLGRWQSAAFLRYIRTPKEQLATVSAQLARQGHTNTQHGGGPNH